jgi:hypothetical protein
MPSSRVPSATLDQVFGEVGGLLSGERVTKVDGRAVETGLAISRRPETQSADDDEFDRWRVDEALLDDLLLPNVTE